jgi:UDP-2,3-diacylglucosamine pyrophosphatase LpxH
MQEPLRMNFSFDKGQEFRFRLMSDIHIDSPHHDRKAFLDDLEEAKRNQERILINGDFFDTNYYNQYQIIPIQMSEFYNVIKDITEVNFINVIFQHTFLW